MRSYAIIKSINILPVRKDNFLTKGTPFPLRKDDFLKKKTTFSSLGWFKASRQRPIVL